MNRFKQNALIKIHKARREKARRIKKEFVETGDAQKMIDTINKKRKQAITPEDLPF